MDFELIDEYTNKTTEDFFDKIEKIFSSVPDQDRFLADQRPDVVIHLLSLDPERFKPRFTRRLDQDLKDFVLAGTYEDGTMPWYISSGRSLIHKIVYNEGI